MKAEHGDLKHIVINGEPYLVEETVFNFTMCLSRENAALKSRQDQAIRDAVTEEQKIIADLVADIDPEASTETQFVVSALAAIIRARKP